MPRKGSNKKSVTKSKGLGDTVEKVAKATGVKKIVEKVFTDCGCQKRKEWLNRTFPYVNAQKKCMTEDQYEYYKGFREEYMTGSQQFTVPGDEMEKLIDLYNSIFQVDVKGCSDCNAGHFIKKLDAVYLLYEEDRKNSGGEAA